MLDAANTTFRKSTLYACPTPFFSAISNVEEEFRNADDVLQVEDPAQKHLDRERHHREEQEHADVEPRRAHLLVVRLEHGLGQNPRQREHVEQDQEDPEDIAT